MVSRSLLVAACCLVASHQLAFAQRALAQSPRKAARVADEIVHLRAEWAKDLRAKQLDQIAALYAPDAILLSTFDPKPLETPAQIAAYFQKLTQNLNLKATVQTEKIHAFADGGVDSGLYIFSYTKDGKEVRVPARFTFVFHRNPTGWLIVSHHSSVVPPGPRR